MITQQADPNDKIGRFKDADEMELKRKKMEVVFRNIVDEAKTDNSRV